MSFLSWDQAYSVRHSELDRQHQRIFALINELHHAMFGKVEKERVAATIRELVKYVDEHFAAEERAMEEGGYPRLAEHKEAHERLKKRVQEIELHFHEEKDSMAGELFGFLLGDWLVKHILEMDRQYAPYMKHPASVDIELQP